MNREPEVCLFTVSTPANRMAEIIPSVIRTPLLLLCFFSASVNGEESLILAQLSNGITYPCGQDIVCYHVWKFSTEATHDHIAIVRNGEIRTAPTAEAEDSQCTLKIKEITAEDAGRHHCKRRPILVPFYNVPSNSPQLNLMPGNTESLQCVLLNYVQQGRCYTQLQQQVSLTWVDESGAVIQEDSQQHINQKTACDVTLTFTSQSPVRHNYRCQVTVGDQVRTSVEFSVGRPAPKRKGRFMLEKEPESQGGNQDTVGLAVGLVGCAVLSAVAAAFVVKSRRRKNQQMQKESGCTISSSNAVNADDVIYADIMLPAGSDFVLVHENESTEYACVRYQ